MAQREYRKSDGNTVTPVSFRLPANLKDDLDDLAMSMGVTISSILIDFIEKLVEANKDQIEAYRKIAAMPIARLQFVPVDQESEDEELDEDGDDEEETTL